MGTIREKLWDSGIQFFVTALKGSLKEVTDRTTRTFSVVFWLY